MAIETQTGQHSEPGQKKPVAQVFNEEEVVKGDQLNLLLEEIDSLKKKSGKIDGDLRQAEQKIKGIKFQTNFMAFIVGAIAVLFVITVVTIGLEYVGNNEERYEKFIDKTEEIKQNFYTKEQTNSEIKSSFNEIKNQFDNLKNCLKSKKYWQYGECF